MLKRSKIGWTDFSGADLNFLIGCTPVSEGCANCYARRIIQDRGGRDFSAITYQPAKLLRLHTAAFSAVGAPFRRGPGSRPLAFVVDLGDLFHPQAPMTALHDFLALAQARPDVDWQILTKRAGLLHFDLAQWYAAWPGAAPLANLWAGVTVENQKRATQRLPELLATPAAVRFVSAEPLLGPLDLRPWLAGLDWVIVGGESGPRRRPFDVAWAADLRDQCQAAGVAYFFKQSGGQYPGTEPILAGRLWREFPR